MISSEEAGVELHIVSSKVIARFDMPDILKLTANFISNDFFASIPAATMLRRCNDWQLDGIEIQGAKRLNLLSVKLGSPIRDPYYKVNRTYDFEFELLTAREVTKRKKAAVKVDAHSNLRRFNNLITDDV